MKATEYLYGISPSELENKFYLEALHYKRDAASKLYKSLFLKKNRTKEDNDQMFYVHKAIEHNNGLIQEMEDG